MKKEYGAENVCDFSLGNPNVPPPEKFNEILREVVSTCGLDDHCYMPNTGYPLVCGSVAEYLSKEQRATFSAPEAPQVIRISFSVTGARCSLDRYSATEPQTSG